MSRRRSPGRATLVLAVTAVVAACAGGPGPATTMIPASIGPSRTVSPAVALTRGDLERALGERGLALQDVQTPFRPPEGTQLSVAPRAVYQVVLPQDPDNGFLVVYELADPDRAQQAAEEQATYLGTGYGRVQSSLDAVDVIRVVGSTVVLYTWVPGASPDPKTPEIQAALETLGLGVDVPS